MIHSVARLKCCERVGEKAGGLGPSLEDDAIGVSAKCKAAVSDDVAIFVADVLINETIDVAEVFDAQDGNLKTIDRLDEAWEGRGKSPMVNHGVLFVQSFKGRRVNEVIGDAPGALADEGGLEEIAPISKIVVKLGVQGFCVRATCCKEVDPA